jgi:hypothetical protein
VLFESGRSAARPLNLVHALLSWAAIIPLAIAKGVLRERLLVRIFGEKVARTLSGAILSAVIFGWTWLILPWIGHAVTSAWIALGAGWMALTIAFEFSFGRFVARRTWEELRRPYRFENGEVWLLVLLVVAVSPALVATRRAG